MEPGLGAGHGEATESDAGDGASPFQEVASDIVGLAIGAIATVLEEARSLRVSRAFFELAEDVASLARSTKDVTEAVRRASSSSAGSRT